MLVVQCDFDDTVTLGNVSVAIREKFGPPNWLEMEDDYLLGRYSVEESNIRQYESIKTTKQELETFVVQQTRIRHGFSDFHEYCRQMGVRLVIVSSGLDIYIRPILSKLGLDDIEFHSGCARITPSGIVVKYLDPSQREIRTGFKDSYVRYYKNKGNLVAYVGDGISDIAPAREADFMLGRSALLDDARREGLECHPFETFGDVTEIIGRLIG